MKAHRRPAVAETSVVAVDWLTITANSKDQRDIMLSKFHRVKTGLALLGEIPEEFHWRGYDGLAIGNVKWGTRKDSDILLLHGQDANSFWSTFVPCCSNCSRIDLAVTAFTRKCYPRLMRTYTKWVAENSNKTAKKITLLEKGDGIGQTLYVGSRSSDQYGRVYDKGAQLRDPLLMHRMWRYEVELKSKRALFCLGELMTKNGPGEIANFIQATVHTWFDQRDIPPIFDKPGVNGSQFELTATVTTSQEKLAWLRSQVRPTVAKLRAAGLEKELLESLGFDDLRI